MSYTEKGILRQFHFYFSDSNLKTDEFMKTCIESDKDGYVPLKQFLENFPRITATKITLPELQEILKKSNRLELNEDKTAVRRIDNSPVVDIDRDACTLYIKSLPTCYTLEQVQDFVQDKLGAEPVRVILRQRTAPTGTNNARVFKGSFFVEFYSEEDAEKIWNDFGKQTEETDARKESIDKIRILSFEDFEKLPVDDLKEQLIVLKKKDWDGFDKLAAVNAKKQAKKEAKKEELNPEFVPGLILSIDNLPISKEGEESPVSRESLRVIFEKFGDIKFTDMSIGNKTAYIRYSINFVDAAKNAVEKFNNEPLVLNGTKVDVKLLTGEDEINYYRAFVNKKNNNNGGKKSFRNNKRIGGRR